MESGELPIGIAVVAAPSADDRGNLTGMDGPSACGSLGYAMADARCSRRVLAVTDDLVSMVAPLVRSRLPIVVDRVTTVSTPGDTVDILVTERGMTVNPRRPELKDSLLRAGLPVMSIEKLRDTALSITGIPRSVKAEGRTVGIVEYRDGRIIDEIAEVC